MDPLDGTTNFLHGIPIGLYLSPWNTKEIVAGIIYDPIKDELFSAKGRWVLVK